MILSVIFSMDPAGGAGIDQAGEYGADLQSGDEPFLQLFDARGK
jgi:hypothetical protein